jgi:hypothetical protein
MQFIGKLGFRMPSMIILTTKSSLYKNDLSEISVSK